MTTYAGIDLGTTNSAIASFNGADLQVYKSPEGHPVTPSVIYYDRRGTAQYAGARAYSQLPLSPESCARTFKRFIGTSTPIKVPAAGLTLTPEQCSAQILEKLYAYLPEEIRNASDGGTVITVPAAFNQMQKDATLAAAEAAGIGRVALMQEPVAAVMSVMRVRNADGIFLVYDFGGGTLDVAIAQSISGRVSLLDHGGVAMCGGADFDRAILDNVVKPWLFESFKLPENFVTDPKYSRLLRIANHASEQAKIDLSGRLEAMISEGEETIRTTDLAGAEIYLSVPIERGIYNRLIEAKIQESVAATREVIARANLQPQDIERIVFVGGPTQCAQMRDRVITELGIAGNTDVNPMTAVAEGAALFAESIDWSTANRSRKSNRGTVSGGTSIGVAFNYQARTPDVKAKVVAVVRGRPLPGSSFQIDSLDSGWSSGKVALADNAALALPLSKLGDNRFKVFVFDPSGGPISLAQSAITITKTAATIDAIPASHSVGVAAKDRAGGQVALEYLVKAGDPLPKKGQLKFRAEESLKAGGPNAIRLELWEGEIKDPYTDNRPIGHIKITGSDFEHGVIAAQAELICDYEMSDSGAIAMSITVPSIGATINPGHNFYSRQDAQINYADAAEIVRDGSESVLARVDKMSQTVSDPRIDEARAKAEEARASADSPDPAVAKESMDKLLEAKALLAKARSGHLAALREIELAEEIQFFETDAKQYATPTEVSAFDRMSKAARNCLTATSDEFERHRSEMGAMSFRILWRQDHFIIELFRYWGTQEHRAGDKAQHAMLMRQGEAAVQKGDIDELRKIVRQLRRISISTADESDLIAQVNILRG